MVKTHVTVEADSESQEVVVYYDDKEIRRLTPKEAYSCGGQIAKVAKTLSNSSSEMPANDTVSVEKITDEVNQIKDNLDTESRQVSEDLDKKYVSEEEWDESVDWDEHRTKINSLLSNSNR